MFCSANDIGMSDGKVYEEGKSRWVYFWTFLVISIIVIGIAWAYGCYIHDLVDEEKLSQGVGVFGDQFGALTCIFSGLAFAGMVVTLWMQSEELKLQRNETRDNREVMEMQKEEMEGQRKAMELQNLETTFNTLLNFHYENTSKIASYTIHTPAQAYYYSPANNGVMPPDDESYGFNELYGSISTGSDPMIPEA